MSETFYRHALPEGEILGDYQILSVLGAGGFGVTYLVQHRTMGDRFALKEYFPQSLADRQSDRSVVIRTNTFEDPYYKGLHSFLEEARIVRRLRGHPNVVHVNTFFEANNTAYMVMEYYSGQTLTSFKRQSGDHLDEPTIRRIFKPVLDALEYVHERGVVHRDLKPDNIFLCEDGRPILLDFGASRAAAAGSTVPLTAVLTPGFAPPEQYITEDSGETVLRQGPWTDLYALAATLHAIACGRAPYDAMSRRMAGGADPQPPARTRLDGYGEAFCNAIDAALRLDQHERPQSVAAFREIWDGQVAPIAVSGPTAVPTQLPPPRTAAAPPVALPPATAGGAPVRPVPTPPTPPTPPLPAAAAAPRLVPPPARAGLPWLPITLTVILLAGAGLGGWWLLRPKPTTVATGKLVLTTDLDCQLRIGGSDGPVLKAAQPQTALEQPIGTLALECIALSDTTFNDARQVIVSAGQDTPVEFLLAPPEDTADTADTGAQDSTTDVAGDSSGAVTGRTGTATGTDPDPGAVPMPQLIVLAKPEFYSNEGTDMAADGGPIGAQLSASLTPDTGAESFIVDNGLTLRFAVGPSSMSPTPAWTGYDAPDFVPAEFDGQKLLKVIDSGAQVLSLYGPDFSTAYILLSQDASNGKMLYALDFSNYASPDGDPAAASAAGTFQQIVWAQAGEGVLFVSHAHRTYANSSNGSNGYITALDTEEFKVIWRTSGLVDNAENFAAFGTHLISGYGFTDEDDFLYAIDAGSGAVVQRVKVKNGPSFLWTTEDRLYVRTYDTDYVFALEAMEDASN